MNHINKPSGFNPMANSHPTQFNKHHVISNQESHGDKTQRDVYISDKSVIALKMVHQSVSSKLTSLHGFGGEIKETESEKLHLFDFEAVAKNVMSFVNSSISAAKSRGTSSDDLEVMLRQARQGVNNGIDEAIDELSELSVLTEELAGGIEKARSLIHSGLDEIEEKLTSDSLNVPTSSSSLTSKAIDYINESYTARTNSSDLSITTVDGDIVNIRFAALKENQELEKSSYFSRQNTKELDYQTETSSHSKINFSFSVQGELDKDELEAIESLINDISKIEHDFFSGNIDNAFNNALALGYDEKELKSFDLDLRQTNHVSQAYSAVANYNEKPNEELKSAVRPVHDFIAEFKELRDNANQILDKETNQFNKLLESVFNSEFDHNQQLFTRFNKFIEKLM